MVRKDGNSIILKGNGPLVWKEVLQSHFFIKMCLIFNYYHYLCTVFIRIDNRAKWEIIPIRPSQ